MKHHQNKQEIQKMAINAFEIPIILEELASDEVRSVSGAPEVINEPQPS